MRNDKHLMAAWEAYTVVQDEEDLADTLRVLCDVRRDNGAAESQQEVDSNPVFGIANIHRNENVRNGGMQQN